MRDLSAEAWEERYREENIPWDLKGPTPEFARICAEPWFPKKGRALVPGGGRGHDAILLARAGLETHLVDFAPSALRAVQEEASRQKATVLTYRQDFFRLPNLAALHESFDLFLEYTFFCAIDPALRKEYARVAHGLLKPGGLLIGLFFPLATDKPGPPFPVSREEVAATFAPYFEVDLREPRASVKPRAGRELLGVFRRR